MEGICPACGRSWPAANVCHVCGGKAEPGDYMHQLGARNLDPGPSIVTPWRNPDGTRVEVLLVTLMYQAVEIGDIEATESGRPERTGVSRLLRELGQRTPYYRKAWRSLLNGWFAAQALGRAVAFDEKTTPKVKPAVK